MRSREVPVEGSAGLTLAYDLTEIIPGERKGAVLRRGHVIGEGDIVTLRRIGKSSIKVLDLEEDEIHEDEAALVLAKALSGPGLEVTMPGEAWANVSSLGEGLLKVDVARLLEVNLVQDVLVATIHNNSTVALGDIIAKAKVLGLVTKKRNIEEVIRVAGQAPVLTLLPFQPFRIGLAVTGNEVFSGRIKDAFGPLIQGRLARYKNTVATLRLVPDSVQEVAGTVAAMLEDGMELILVTGGMSPDDCTPEGIRQSGAQVVFSGAPVAPGAMTLLAYAGNVPVLGIPAGVLARPRGLLDLVLPRLLAGEQLTSKDMLAYAHGGLCRGCDTCTFPACSFGKGG
ncbi:MAG: molybdopterin-binding protein [Bacillota bacterium]